MAYPDLAVGCLQLGFASPLSQEVSFLLFDVMGRVFYRESISAGSKTTRISLSDVAAGMYFVEVLPAGGT